MFLRLAVSLFENVNVVGHHYLIWTVEWQTTVRHPTRGSEFPIADMSASPTSGMHPLRGVMYAVSPTLDVALRHNA